MSYRQAEAQAKAMELPLLALALEMVGRRGDLQDAEAGLHVAGTGGQKVHDAASTLAGLNLSLSLPVRCSSAHPETSTRHSEAAT